MAPVQSKPTAGEGRTTRKRLRTSPPHDPPDPHTELMDPDILATNPPTPSADITTDPPTRAESVQSTPGPHGSHPMPPQVFNSTFLPHQSHFDVQPFRPAELTVWAMELARTATSGVARTVARQDAVGYGTPKRELKRLLEVRTSKKTPSGMFEIKTNRAQNIDAMYAQMFGDEQYDPCTDCVKGHGPFTECVVHPSIGSDACANCAYGSSGSRCTLRKGSKKRAQKPKKSKKGAASSDDEQPGRVVYVSAECERRLKQMKPAHWQAIAELAQAYASGRWTYMEEPADSDDLPE